MDLALCMWYQTGTTWSLSAHDLCARLHVLCGGMRKTHVDLLVYNVDNICYWAASAHTHTLPMITSIYYSILLDFQVVLWRPRNIKIQMIFITFSASANYFQWVNRFFLVISNDLKVKGSKLWVSHWTWVGRTSRMNRKDMIISLDFHYCEKPLLICFALMTKQKTANSADCFVLWMAF